MAIYTPIDTDVYIARMGQKIERLCAELGASETELRIVKESRDAAHQEVERLRAENAALREAIADQPSVCPDCGVAIPPAPDHPAHGVPCPVAGCTTVKESLADEIERLRARLAEAMKYAQHFTDCEWVDNGCRNKADHPCSCGLDAFLADQPSAGTPWATKVWTDEKGNAHTREVTREEAFYPPDKGTAP